MALWYCNRPFFVFNEHLFKNKTYNQEIVLFTLLRVLTCLRNLVE